MQVVIRNEGFNQTTGREDVYVVGVVNERKMANDFIRRDYDELKINNDFENRRLTFLQHGAKLTSSNYEDVTWTVVYAPTNQFLDIQVELS